MTVNRFHQPYDGDMEPGKQKYLWYWWYWCTPGIDAMTRGGPFITLIECHNDLIETIKTEKLPGDYAYNIVRVKRAAPGEWLKVNITDVIHLINTSRNPTIDHYPDKPYAGLHSVRDGYHKEAREEIQAFLSQWVEHWTKGDIWVKDGVVMQGRTEELISPMTDALQAFHKTVDAG